LPGFDDFEDDAQLLFGAVRRAGELGRSLTRKSVKRWSKPDGSEVTEADLEIDALLKNTLQSARPSYGWLSEETPDGTTRLNHDRIWIVDPIDGTRAFINGKTEWCVAAALVARGRPVVAAVYRPMEEEFFSAIAGRGAFFDSTPMTIADSVSLQGARIAGNRKALGSLASSGVHADVSGDLPLQLRLAFVAAGRIDGAVSIGNRNDWDLAAGDLLVIEAGGQVSDTFGSRYVYNRPESWQHGLVAAGAKRHAAIINAMRTP
jgi:myo-inositol-1(or 4)-monophosphatase